MSKIAPSLPDLKELISRDASLCDLWAWTARAFQAEGRNDPGHDLEHSLRVALWTLRLGTGSFRPQAAVAAALLHDLVNPPKNSPERLQASELSADKARRILPDFKFDSAEINDITDAIRTHSFSRGEEPTSDLGRALQDADRLEALGAIGLFRTIATGVKMQAELVPSQDPWAKHRALDDKKFSVDHFFTKLLKLPETMKTAEGKVEALRRAEFLEAFLRHLGDEIGHPYGR